MPKLPKPVTKKSTKKDLWEELQASRAEIDHQQDRIKEMMIHCSQLEQKDTEYTTIIKVLQNQISTVRAAVELRVNLIDSDNPRG